jgi:hypothetical protein
MGCKGSRVRIPPSRPFDSKGQLSQGAGPFVIWSLSQVPARALCKGKHFGGIKV